MLDRNHDNKAKTGPNRLDKNVKGVRTPEMESLREQAGIAHGDDRPTGEFLQEKREHNPRNFYNDPQIVRSVKTDHRSWHTGLAEEEPVEQEGEPEMVQAKCASCGGDLPPPDDGDSGGKPCPKCQAEAAAEGMVQMQEEEGADTATESTEGPANPIVDNATVPEEGQMRQADFLRRLKAEVCETVDRELSGTPFSSRACPYIERTFDRHADSSPAELLAVIQRYAPGADTGVPAARLIVLVTLRARNAVRNWAQTGDLSAIPDEFQDQIPASLRMANGLRNVGRSIGNAGRSIARGISDLGSSIVSRIGGLFRKAKPGGTAKSRPPAAIKQSLGRGTTMDGPLRGRMEAGLGPLPQVQLHTDPEAGRMAEDMNARAFTVGNHVAFAPGQYQPGTVIGDALIAHELAHTQQQAAGTASPAAYGELEADADQAAAGAVAGMHGDAAVERPGVRVAGMRLQRCNMDEVTVDEDMEIHGTVDIPAEYSEPTSDLVAENQEMTTQVALLEPEIRRAYDDYQFYLDISNDPDGYGIEHIVEEKREHLESLLEPHGLTIDDFEGLRGRFQAFFERYALRIAFQMLDSSEAHVREEVGRYAQPDAQQEDQFQALWEALEPMRELQADNERMQEAYEQMVYDMTHDEDGRPRMASAYAAAGPARDMMDAQRANAERARTIAMGLKEQFPVLADDEMTLSVMGTSDQSRLREAIPEIGRNRLRDIQETRENLVENPEQVWKLENVIAVAKQQYGVSSGDVHEMFIDHKVSSVRGIDTLITIALAALAVVFGLMTGGSGWVLAAGLVGSAAISGISLYRNYEDYQFRSAASGTHFDTADALTAEEPSMFWLALDIVFFAVDVAAAFRLFRAASAIIRTARGAGQAGDDVAEALMRSGAFGSADNFAQGGGARECAERIGQSFDEAVEAAGHITRIAERFPDGLSQSVRQLLERDPDLLARAVSDPQLINPRNLAAWEDIGRIGPVNPETYDMLLANPSLREALIEFPDAAAVLRKCMSPCFPPQATREHVAAIQEYLARAEREGFDVDMNLLNDYIYQNRDNLDDVVARLRNPDVAHPHGTIPARTPQATMDEVLDAYPGVRGSDAEEAVTRLLDDGVSTLQMQDILRHAHGAGVPADELLRLMEQVPAAYRGSVFYPLSRGGDEMTDMVGWLRDIESRSAWRNIGEELARLTDINMRWVRMPDGSVVQVRVADIAPGPRGMTPGDYVDVNGQQVLLLGDEAAMTGVAPVFQNPAGYAPTVRRPIDGADLVHAPGGHATSAHGVHLPHCEPILNGPEHVFSGIYPASGRHVDVYYQAGSVVITEHGNKLSVITAYGTISHEGAVPVSRWLNHAGYIEIPL